MQKEYAHNAQRTENDKATAQIVVLDADKEHKHLEKLLQLVQWVAINCKIFQYFSLTVTPVNLQQPATSLNEPKDLNFKKSEIRWMINSLNMWLFKTIFLIIVSLNLALSLVISCYCW